MWEKKLEMEKKEFVLQNQNTPEAHYLIIIVFCKDTALLMMPYFQPVYDHVRDTMHNLCSGKIYSQL